MFPPPDIHLRPNSTRPVGPPFLARLLRGEPFRRHAADALLANTREFGDLVSFSAFGKHFLQFNHPELIAEMLVRDAPYHHRNLVMQRSKAILGEGLLTSEEPLHMRQRRLAQPAFHRQRIAAYADIMTDCTLRMSGSWTSGATLDIRAEMLLLALRITGKTLFDTEVQDEVHAIAAAVDSFQAFFPLSFLPFSTAIQRLPLPALRRIRRGRVQLDALIYRMIRERRASPADRGDLLSMLLAAEDPESPPNPDGSPARMSDVQVRDECLTALLAGHETTANALAFALHLLAHHPHIQQQLAAECLQVLGGRAPTAADYPALPLAQQVFAESLRLFPPVWVTARTAARDYDYRGFRIRRGTMLLAPQYAVQRDPRFFPGPLAFNPANFTAQAKAARPRFAFFPFGGGSRQCIGEGLAWMEGALVLATLLQHWSFTPVPSATPPSPAKLPEPHLALALDPSISLRAQHPMPLTIQKLVK